MVRKKTPHFGLDWRERLDGISRGQLQYTLTVYADIKKLRQTLCILTFTWFYPQTAKPLLTLGLHCIWLFDALKSTNNHMLPYTLRSTTKHHKKHHQWRDCCQAFFLKPPANTNRNLHATATPQWSHAQAPVSGNLTQILNSTQRDCGFQPIPPHADPLTLCSWELPLTSLSATAALVPLSAISHTHTKKFGIFWGMKVASTNPYPKPWVFIVGSTFSEIIHWTAIPLALNKILKSFSAFQEKNSIDLNAFWLGKDQIGNAMYIF